MNNKYNKQTKCETQSIFLSAKTNKKKEKMQYWGLKCLTNILIVIKYVIKFLIGIINVDIILKGALVIKTMNGTYESAIHTLKTTAIVLIPMTILIAIGKVFINYIKQKSHGPWYGQPVIALSLYNQILSELARLPIYTLLLAIISPVFDIYVERYASLVLLLLTASWGISKVIDHIYSVCLKKVERMRIFDLKQEFIEQTKKNKDDSYIEKFQINELFAFIRNEQDIVDISYKIVDKTRSIVFNASGGNYVRDADALLLQALIGIIHFEFDEQERTMDTLINTLVKLINCDPCKYFENEIGIMFRKLEAEKPNCFAVKKYEHFLGFVNPSQRPYVNLSCYYRLVSIKL